MGAKRFVGQVVSTKMMSTMVVAVDASKRHRVYGKIVRVTRRIKARTVEKFAVGDVVEIEETRPLSREVAFRVVRKVSG